MNSIAYMPKRPATPTKESEAIATAMRDHRLSNAMVAHHMHVSDGMVSQWKTGRRPVPATHAPKLATLLGVDDAAEISAAYSNVRTAQLGNTALAVAEQHPQYSDQLTIRRLENAVDSLRYAIAAITSATVVHRPAEARDVARLIRKHVPTPIARKGLLAELLQALDKAS